MWLVPVTALAAAVLAACWRPILPRSAAADVPEPDRTELFAETLQPIPHDWSAFWITLCIYAAGFELSDGDTVTASGLLAICGFAIAWQLTLAIDDSTPTRTLRKRAALRFLLVTLPALLVTFLALNAWNPTPADGSSASGRIGSGGDSAKQTSQKSSGAMGLGLSGYQSVILWPVTEKGRIVAPLPPGTTPNFDHIAKPLVFRFDGSYWYFQPPHAAPGPEAQIARGTPLAANVRSTNFNPLVMEAHQKLGTPISLLRTSSRNRRLRQSPRKHLSGRNPLEFRYRSQGLHAQPQSLPRSADSRLHRAVPAGRELFPPDTIVPLPNPLARAPAQIR
jgi:hypothetical protein